MVEHPRTRYATSRGVDIAYQVIGDGPVDLLLYTGLTVPIEMMDEEPGLARFLRRLAILDDLGSTSAVVIAPYQSAPDGILLTAMAPDRVAGLVLINGVPMFLKSDDYPHGIDLTDAPDFVRMVDPDAVEQGVDVLSMLGPGVAGNAAFREWFDRAGHLAASPAMARALLGQLALIDVRDALPGIDTRTLVTARTDNRLSWLGPGRSRSGELISR